MVLNKIHSLLLLCFITGLMFFISACTEDAPNPNDTMPFVSIISPGKSSTIYTDTTVEIEATDDKGIARVELYLDYKLDSINRIWTAPPYIWRLSLDSLRDSTVHSLYAFAYDVEGNKKRSDFVASYVRKFLAPLNLSVKYITKDSLELNWEDKTTYEKGFEVEQSGDGVHYSVIQALKANKTKTTIYPHLNKSEDAYFRVRGVRDTIYSPYSKVVKVIYASGGENLFAGGSFTTAGGLNASHIARWDAERWIANSSGVNDIVLTMAQHHNDLYVGGTFDKFGSVTTNYIAKWDGALWSKVGNGFDGKVYSLVEFNGDLYAAGFFVHSGIEQLNYVAKWNGTQWVPVGNGFDGGVYALAVYRGELYATGEFTKSGSETMNHVAKWDGTTWLRLRTGFDKKGFALAVYNDELYVGGTMLTADGADIKYIAKWNGLIWSGVGAGFDNYVYSLQVYNNQLYAGGKFSYSDTLKLAHIGRWSGTTWSPVGKNYGIDYNKPSSYVYSMTTYNGGLYAGGFFASAGSVNTSNISRWNGTTWDEVGGGLNSIVYSLSTYRGDSWQWLLLP